MKWLTLLLLLQGCAIAFGDNSRSAVDINTDFKREVDKGAPMLEDALNPERKPK